MRFTYIGKQKTHKAKEDQEIMAMIMLVEYSWDVDYIAVPCEDREEALEWRQKYIELEIQTERNEKGYTPSVVNVNDTETVLIYAEGIKDYSAVSEYEHMTLKIIEIGHMFRPELLEARAVYEK